MSRTFYLERFAQDDRAVGGRFVETSDAVTLRTILCAELRKAPPEIKKIAAVSSGQCAYAERP